MILYAIPVSTFSAKVRIALAFKQVDYEMVPPPGGYSSPEYKAIVPLGTIPGMRDGDLVISESDSILEYVEERHPRPALLPDDVAARARHRFLGRFHDLWLDPPLRATFRQIAPDTRDEAALNATLDRYEERLRLLESMVEPAPFLLGDTFGMADCAFPATFTLADILFPLFGRSLDYGPGLSRWREAAYAVPAVKQVTDESRAATLAWLES